MREFLIMLAASVLASTILLADVNQGLVAHYEFDGDTLDSSGNGQPGIIRGALPVPDRCGIPNRAFLFDGLDDFIEIPHSPEFDVTEEGQWTVSYWLKTQVQKAFQHGVDKYDEADSDGWGVDIRDGRVQGRLNNGLPGCCTNSYNRVSTAPRIDDGRWHLATVVFNATPSQESGSMSIYVDGIQRETVRVAGNFRPGMNYDRSVRIVVGKAFNRDVSPEFFEGAIDDVRIYSRAISEEEIQELFSASCPMPATCSGFDPPLDSGPVSVRNNRALPLKAELFDQQGVSITDLELTAAPVLQVLFAPASGDEVLDVTSEALPAGAGTEGNQFVFSDGLWRFNLKTKNYTAPSTYTMTLTSGDQTEYVVEPCSAEFVVSQ